jgi:hypothetical protein
VCALAFVMTPLGRPFAILTRSDLGHGPQLFGGREHHEHHLRADGGTGHGTESAIRCASDVSERRVPLLDGTFKRARSDDSVRMRPTVGAGSSSPLRSSWALFLCGPRLQRASAQPRFARAGGSRRQPAGSRFRLCLCQHFLVLAGPHPRSLSRGDYAPRSGRRRCRIGHLCQFQSQSGTTTALTVSCLSRS